MDLAGLDTSATSSRAHLLGRVDHFCVSVVPGTRGADGESGVGVIDAGFEAGQGAGLREEGISIVLNGTVSFFIKPLVCCVTEPPAAGDGDSNSRTG